MKYVIVTGGGFSSIGKGITSSSLAVLAKFFGHHPTCIKIDPYLNVDSNNMSPFEHGETFVSSDGNPSDLDIGSYERFLDIELTADHNITSGKIYKSVIEKERNGEYLGKTVQIVPHITDEIINWIKRVSMLPVNRKGDPVVPDICFIELGGTVGDIEISPHLTALSTLSYVSEPNSVCHVHVSYIPFLSTTGEPKTKIVQHSIQTLRQSVNPDILCLRCETPLPDNVINKLSLLCRIPSNNIVVNADASSIYDVPLLFYRRNVYSVLQEKLKLESSNNLISYLDHWTNFTHKFKFCYSQQVNIGIVGKYTGLNDSYLSVTHAITHACIHLGVKPNIIFINSEKLQSDEETFSKLKFCDAYIIPGGYGNRGVQGMLFAAEYSRKNNIPCLGICLGLQVQIVEFARNMLQLDKADSEEFNNDAEIKVINQVFSNHDNFVTDTTRLGKKRIHIQPDTKSYDYYRQPIIVERHRHRYKVNNFYSKLFRQNGFKPTGISEDSNIIEIMELENHPFYIGVQYHPEFQTFPLEPHPLFLGIISSIKIV